MKERTVSDVLSGMDISEVKAISLLCDYASGLLNTPTPEVVSAAYRIRYEMNEEQQKVAYYLIGCAREDYKKPIILLLYE